VVLLLTGGQGHQHRCRLSNNHGGLEKGQRGAGGLSSGECRPHPVRCRICPPRDQLGRQQTFINGRLPRPGLESMSLSRVSTRRLVGLLVDCFLNFSKSDYGTNSSESRVDANQVKTVEMHQK
jgi:hypothetical protein